MEELLGAIFELFFEIFMHLFVEIASAIISSFVTKVEDDPKLKNRIKMIVSFTFFGLSILLLILALVFKKTFLITFTLSYLFVLIVLNLFKFINRNIWKKDFVDIIIGWIRRIVHYAFPIVLIITGSLFLTNNAKIWLNVLSTIAIIVYMGIDIYKAQRFFEKRRAAKNYDYN